MTLTLWGHRRHSKNNLSNHDNAEFFGTDLHNGRKLTQVPNVGQLTMFIREVPKKTVWEVTMFIYKGSKSSKIRCYTFFVAV